jgi:hypothetical protein
MSQPIPDNGIPCAHRERRQGDQSRRLKRIFEQIASVSDAELTSFEIGVHIPMPLLMIVPLADNAVNPGSVATRQKSV